MAAEASRTEAHRKEEAAAAVWLANCLAALPETVVTQTDTVEAVPAAAVWLAKFLVDLPEAAATRVGTAAAAVAAVSEVSFPVSSATCLRLAAEASLHNHKTITAVSPHKGLIPEAAWPDKYSEGTLAESRTTL